MHLNLYEENLNIEKPLNFVKIIKIISFRKYRLLNSSQFKIHLAYIIISSF